jgi:hypothetical protein
LPVYGADPIAEVQVIDLSISSLISLLWNQLLGFQQFVFTFVL